MDYAREMVKKLNDSYFAADLVALYDLLDPSGNPCPISDEYEYQLNRKRNDNWLVRLPSLMSEASSFIAVGALHICGEEGLLFQLDKMGYTVAPVK